MVWLVDTLFVDSLIPLKVGQRMQKDLLLQTRLSYMNAFYRNSKLYIEIIIK